MSFKTNMAKAEALLAEVKAAMAQAGASPMLVHIVGDPERRGPGPDECLIAGVKHLRESHESRGEFDHRMLAMGVKAGLRVVLISLEDFGPGPFLDDFAQEVDQTKTIEIAGSSDLSPGLTRGL
jgi:hypothetical protein